VLTTPLSVTGAPKELDEQLPRQLVEFVEAHLGLSSTLKSAKEQMEAAAKAAREAARKPTNSNGRGRPQLGLPRLRARASGIAIGPDHTPNEWLCRQNPRMGAKDLRQMGTQ
jgi:hypothetical protein